MEKDCGMWINILSRKIKKRMNANMQDLGLTGMQSRVMHYILVKYAAEPVFQRDVEGAFGLSRSTATGILQLMEKNGLILRESAANDARDEKFDSHRQSSESGCSNRGVSSPDRTEAYQRPVQCTDRVVSGECCAYVCQSQ